MGFKFCDLDVLLKWPFVWGYKFEKIVFFSEIGQFAYQIKKCEAYNNILTLYSDLNNGKLLQIFIFPLGNHAFPFKFAICSLRQNMP